MSELCSTGNDPPWSVFDAFMKMSNVAAIKYTSMDLTILLELLRNYPDKETRGTAILQGNEYAFDTAMLLGADGVVTGGGTLFIKTLNALCNAAAQGDRLGAFKLQQEFRKKMDDMLGPDLAIDFMHVIKSALTKKGICQAHVTRPFLKRKLYLKS